MRIFSGRTLCEGPSSALHTYAACLHSLYACFFFVAFSSPYTASWRAPRGGLRDRWKGEPQVSSDVVGRASYDFALVRGDGVLGVFLAPAAFSCLASPASRFLGFRYKIGRNVLRATTSRLLPPFHPPLCYLLLLPPTPPPSLPVVVVRWEKKPSPACTPTRRCKARSTRAPRTGHRRTPQIGTAPSPQAPARARRLGLSATHNRKCSDLLVPLYHGSIVICWYLCTHGMILRMCLGCVVVRSLHMAGAVFW